MWNIPRDPIGCIRSTAMVYVVPLATDVKTMTYMGLRAISGSSAGSSRLGNSVQQHLFMYIGIFILPDSI
eukprot:3263835-Pleurochrysis_carterae.AAC.2